MKKNNNKVNVFGTSEVVFLIIITCLLSFTMAYLVFSSSKNNIEVSKPRDEYIDKFVKQYNDILENYYKDVDKDKLIDSAVKGMIENLGDPYATYFDELEAKNFNTRLDGEYEGLGLEIIKLENGHIGVVSVFDDSPAFKAEILAGDEIISLNETDVNNMTTIEFSSKALENEENIIKIIRNGVQQDIKIKKGKIIIKSASSKMLDNNIGYLKIDLFALNTYDQVKENLEKLQKQGMKSLIIDLRNNSGGHLSSVSDILSLFLSKKHIMYQIKQNENVEKVYSKGKKDFDKKIVVLVNNSSASASEVLASSLKENLSATIVGQITFGKGTAQKLVTLPTGEQYKFTIKEWLSPNGNTINEVGIKPDIEETDESLCIDRAMEILKD